MILGFEVKQLCLGFDIIYDRRFEKKKKNHIQEGDCFLPLLDG